MVIFAEIGAWDKRRFVISLERELLLKRFAKAMSAYDKDYSDAIYGKEDKK